MGNLSKLAEKINAGDFVITAEYLPQVGTAIDKIDDLKNSGAISVNVADNPYGPVMSSLASSVILSNKEVEPVYQIVTRDRNRIALQSDILGAAALGIKNILCLAGYHQTLTGSPGAANVYGMDSIQLIDAINTMNNDGLLMDGEKIEGDFSMFPGAVANPYLAPLELNIIRLTKKIQAGAKFIQTQAVFDTTAFGEWLSAANNDGLTEKAAFIAGIFPLRSYDETQMLLDKHTDFYIPESQVKRMKDAGDAEAQKKTGIEICVETIEKIKGLKGLRGIHILSGGKENLISEIISASGL